MIGRVVKIGKSYFDQGYQNIMDEEGRMHDEQVITLFLPKEALVDDKNHLDRHTLQG